MDSTPVVVSRRNKWIYLLFITSEDIQSLGMAELESTMAMPIYADT
jgi:hypothetical protein